MSEKIKVLCVDDNADLGEMFSFLVSSETDMECIGLLSSAENLVEEIGSKKPHVVLLDLTMPGKDPMQEMSKAANLYPSTRTIVISGYDDEATKDQALESKAWGFVSKQEDMEMILEAIRTVAGGEIWLKRNR